MMATTIVDKVIKIKMKISRIKYLESRLIGYFISKKLDYINAYCY